MTTNAKVVPPKRLEIRGKMRIESAAGTELIVYEDFGVEQCREAMEKQEMITISYPSEFKYPPDFRGVKMSRSFYLITAITAPKNGEFSVFVHPTRA